MNTRIGYTIAAMSAYAALCVLFFAVRYSELYPSNRWIVAVPTVFAAIAALPLIRCGGAYVPLALAASALGDLWGSRDILLGQIGFFAAAHVFYICDFIRNAEFSLRRIIAAAPLTAALACYVVFVVRSIGSAAESVAVALYAAVIFGMGFCAVSQRRERKVWYAAAASLFILSDGMIAYGLAGGRIANSGLWIMITYYTAQGLFAWLFSMRRTPLD